MLPFTTIGCFRFTHRLFQADVLKRARFTLNATSLPVNVLPSDHLIPGRTTIVYCLAPVHFADCASQLMYLSASGS